MCASFDLHVLSTPPAFILSQDQTLMLDRFIPVQGNLLAFPFYCLSGCNFRCFLFVEFLSLNVFQSCFTVQLSRSV